MKYIIIFILGLAGCASIEQDSLDFQDKNLLYENVVNSYTYKSITIEDCKDNKDEC
tara:strand:- start:82 stop:249 length:168 start_codon:yes stop_codon:yes gene_type:complete